MKMDGPSVVAGGAARGNESLGSHDERPTTVCHRWKSRTRPTVISTSPSRLVYGRRHRVPIRPRHPSAADVFARPRSRPTTSERRRLQADRRQRSIASYERSQSGERRVPELAIYGSQPASPVPERAAVARPKLAESASVGGTFYRRYLH